MSGWVLYPLAIFGSIFGIAILIAGGIRIARRRRAWRSAGEEDVRERR